MIELLVLGATLTIAAWATGAQAHQRNVASRTLERYARSRGLVFVPSPPTPRGSSPRVVGAKNGVDYAIELYRLSGEMRTRISATATRGRSPVLSILQRGAFSLRQPAAIVVGDEAFDRSYIVTAGAPEDAEGLREATRALLLVDDRRTGVWLSSDGLRVSVSWRGMESDPLVLDAARDVVAMVAGWHRPESPYR